MMGRIFITVIACLIMTGFLFGQETVPEVDPVTTSLDGVTSPSEIKKLALVKQKLQEFPKEILNLVNLTYLDLSRNKIEKIPESISNLTKLETLILSKNKISIIPDVVCELPNLKVLVLSQNQITRFPENIGKMTALEKLDVWSNDFESFPESLRQLQNLKVLDLRGILMSEREQAHIKSMLPNTELLMDNPCNCDF